MTLSACSPTCRTDSTMATPAEASPVTRVPVTRASRVAISPPRARRQTATGLRRRRRMGAQMSRPLVSLLPIPEPTVPFVPIFRIMDHPTEKTPRKRDVRREVAVIETPAGGFAARQKRDPSKSPAECRLSECAGSEAQVLVIECR